MSSTHPAVEDFNRFLMRVKSEQERVIQSNQAVSQFNLHAFRWV